MRFNCGSNMKRLVLATLVFASAVYADDAASIVARWTAALGGAEKINAIETIHRVAKSSDDGTPGTLDEWITRSLERRALQDHAHDSVLDVFDGTHAWRRDWNGFVGRREGSDLKREIDFAILHGFGALTGAAGAPELVSDGVIRFHPQGGMPITYTIDNATGLPSRAEVPSFDGVLAITFSDYRDVDGVKIPFTETEESGPSKSELHLTSVDLHPSEHPAFTRPEDGPNDTFFLRNQKSETIPFNFDNNHIILLTTVNGVGPIWMLVDTGADVAYINQSRLGEFHLQTYGSLQTIGGGEQAAGGSYIDRVTFRIGDVELRNQHASVLEFRGLEKLYGMPLAGLLGYDFLSRFVIDIDYPHKTMTLHPRSYSTANVNGARVPLVMQGQQPYLGGSIKVAGETIPTWFILDVGAADTITFTTPFIATHQLLDRAGDPARNVSHVAAPDVEAYAPTNVRGMLDAITIGSITSPHVPVNLSVAKKGAYTSPAFDGNVGETLLQRFAHVWLDYGRDEMILVPGPDTMKPLQERTTFGMTIIASGDDFHTFTVTAVGATSPAKKAGFEKGDVITAVDATPATNMNLAQLKAIIAATGTQHVFTVKRKSEEVKLTATIEQTPLSGLR